MKNRENTRPVNCNAHIENKYPITETVSSMEDWTQDSFNKKHYFLKIRKCDCPCMSGRQAGGYRVCGRERHTDTYSQAHTHTQ